MGLRLSFRRESVLIIILLISVLIERHKIIKCQRFSPWLIHFAVHRRASWCVWAVSRACLWACCNAYLPFNLILSDILSLLKFCWCYFSNLYWFFFKGLITTPLIHLTLKITLSSVIDITHNSSVWSCATSLFFLYPMLQLPHFLTSFPLRLIRILSCFFAAFNGSHE